MKILAVDDEQGALKLLVRAITGACPDDTIFSFQSSTKALQCARENHIDVAFLDIQMPEITGLELAKRLKKINPNINIIFSTGYSEYAVDALKLRSSGYLMKPITRSDVQTELSNLRNPIAAEETSYVFAKTFGNFDLFVKGKILVFPREKSKEVLAYLIDRHGSAVTRKEMAAIIFEDREYTRATQAYLTQIIKNLKKVLDEAEIGDIFVTGQNTYAVDVTKIRCDAYEYLEGDAEALNAFHGEYMCQYSWGEEQMYQFYE